MKKIFFGHLLCLLCLPGMANAAVKGEPVEYSADGVTLKGYLAYDDASQDKRPGILVVHEWWGHNAYARKRADMLAEMGYVALAVDMYGDGKQADHPDDAGKFAGELRQNMPLAQTRFQAAMDFLNQQAQADSSKTAAIGYCFGGGVVLEMARKGLPLKGVASFHGSLAPTGEPAQVGQVKASVAVFNGEADKMVPAEQVAGFKQEMEAAKVDYQYVGYPNVLHSFTNPEADVFAEKFGMPIKYDADADKDSWAKLGEFLSKVFGN
jgi:dienelactone hydrolase